MSNLVNHAQRELELAGLFEPESDYGGCIGEAVMKLIRAFASDEHSGGSAALTLAAFDRVVRFKTLTPLTDNPDGWMEVGDLMWQSRRQSSCFSRDDGKTYYDIDAGDDREIRASEVDTGKEGAT